MKQWALLAAAIWAGRWPGPSAGWPRRRMWCWQTAPPPRPKRWPPNWAAAPARNEDAAGCDLVFLGVKPQMMAGMLAPLQAVFAARAAKGERFVLCTMAAGLTMAQIRQMAGGDYPVVRDNPNIPLRRGRRDGPLLHPGHHRRRGGRFSAA